MKKKEWHVSLLKAVFQYEPSNCLLDEEQIALEIYKNAKPYEKYNYTFEDRHEGPYGYSQEDILKIIRQAFYILKKGKIPPRTDRELVKLFESGEFHDCAKDWVFSLALNHKKVKAQSESTKDVHE